ncbi:hypothetical protein [Palleronia rufa]|uniref:hypothetical protein n=1 Tax=Palleronia rufa TaxID=1530186 RepID=UPI0013773D3D|nr:hypothetical protein [Palleronia rufa]
MPPLWKPDPKRLPSDAAQDGRDARLTIREQPGRSRVFIRYTGLCLPDSDPDRVSRQLVAMAESMQGVAGMIFGNLALDPGAIIAMAFRHELSSESPLPVNSTRSIGPRRGAHSMTKGGRCGWRGIGDEPS